MMLIAVLVLSLSAAATQQPDPRLEAERLARSGANEEALKRFQALAAANPDDTAARLWIGRLHLRLGHARRAAAVFEAIVATESQNVEALTGLGLALTSLGELRAASDALNRAESLAADRVEVLAAQGGLHARANRATLALAYYDRALAADPANDAIRAAADALRASRAHRVELGYNFQTFDPGGGDLTTGTIEVNARVTDTVRLFARGEFADFAGGDGTRGGGGAEWQIAPALHLRGGAQFGSDVGVLPDLDAFGELHFTRGRATWTGRLHVFDFDGADLWIGGPGIAFALTPRLSLQAEYLRGRATFSTIDTITSDNARIGIHARLHPRLAAFAEYHRGIDRLEWFTADRLTADGANTFSAGSAADLTPFIGLAARYDLQDRGSGRVHRAHGRLVVRF